MNALDHCEIEMFDEDETSCNEPSKSSQSTSLNLRLNNPRFKRALPLILSDEYYIIIEQRLNTNHQKIADGVIAVCRVCQKKISGSAKVTSNFLQHLKIKHFEVYAKYLGNKNTGHSHQFHRIERKKQQSFDEKILSFVVETSSLSTVENSAFVTLFEGTNLKVKSQRYISDLLATKHEEMLKRIKTCISQVNYVCCSADVWTSKRRSFLGYTCHWLENDLSRKSVALACRRISNSSTSHSIVDIIQEINTQFGISDTKLVSTVTDNGSNYVKAFHEFGIHCTDEMSGKDSGSDFGDDLEFDSTNLVSQIPKHVQCACHTLNLLASVDFLKALQKSPTALQKHQDALKKCTSIWNKLNRPESSELLKTFSFPTLKTPVVTQWNSLYDAMYQLLACREKLSEITTGLGVEHFSPSEIEYLQEYCQLMQPIAQGIDFLQNKINVYFGYLAPTLLVLKAKLHRFTVSENGKYLKDTTKCMENALVERFRAFFELAPSSHDIILAAITCPAVKLLKCNKYLRIWRQTAPHSAVSFLEEIFVKEVHNNGHRPENRPNPSIKSEIAAHPFFYFEDSNDSEIEQSQDEILNELRNFTENTDSSVASLNKYKNVQELFYKFNTTIPSSAPVERLFSFAGITNIHRRQHLTDDVFEKLVLAKANKFFK